MGPQLLHTNKAGPALPSPPRPTRYQTELPLGEQKRTGRPSWQSGKENALGSSQEIWREGHEEKGSWVWVPRPAGWGGHRAPAPGEALPSHPWTQKDRESLLLHPTSDLVPAPAWSSLGMWALGGSHDSRAYERGAGMGGRECGLDRWGAG